MRKVLIGPSTFGELDKSPLVRLKDAGCEIIKNPYKRRLKKDELLTLLREEVSGLIAGLETLDEEVFKKSKLKVISRCGAGLSNVNLKAAKDLGIKVCYTPDAPTTAVAEITLGAILSLARMIHLMDKDMHNGEWNKRIGAQIEGKTVSIIGFGRIGRKVASMLKPFNVKIIAVDPNLSGKIDDVEILKLTDALKKADIITIHSSGEDEILGKSEFKLMKPGSLLLNAARGSVVNEEALIEALEKNRIAGAWLDTFREEPYNGPLKKYPQVLMTPHIGSYTLECRKNMEMQAVNNLIEAFKGN